MRAYAGMDAYACDVAGMDAYGHGVCGCGSCVSSGVGNAADRIVDAVGMRRSRFVFGLHGSNAGTNRRKEKRCVAEAI